MVEDIRFEMLVIIALSLTLKLIEQKKFIALQNSGSPVFATLMLFRDF